jgi:hypothetical protein
VTRFEAFLLAHSCQTAVLQDRVSRGAFRVTERKAASCREFCVVAEREELASNFLSAGAQRGDRANDAPARSGPASLPERRGERLHQLLFPSKQEPAINSLSACHLLSRAAAAKPDQPTHVTGYETADRNLVATRSTTPAASRRALPRHDPRHEPGAVVPLAGICAGGDEQSSSLPRRTCSAHLA